MRKTVYILLLCISLVVGFVSGRISLQKEMQEIKSKYVLNEFSLKCGKDFDYLAIGNSITANAITNIWWSEGGAAATREENDYFHLVSKYLENRFGSINSQPVSFVQWELLDTNRPETLVLLDPYLNEDIDLITIQLGENIKKTDELENDYNYMIDYIENKAPNAQILLIGTFWQKENMEEIKMNCCETNGICYVNLSELWGRKEYLCGLNTLVYDGEGNEHIVTNSGVAIHPNDKAMKYIADKIIEKIE